MYPVSPPLLESASAPGTAFLSGLRPAAGYVIAARKRVWVFRCRAPQDIPPPGSSALLPVRFSALRGSPPCIPAW